MCREHRLLNLEELAKQYASQIELLPADLQRVLKELIDLNGL